MPNLPLLQTQLDQIPGLLQEVQDLRSVTGSWRDQTYDISHIAPLKPTWPTGPTPPKASSKKNSAAGPPKPSGKPGINATATSPTKKASPKNFATP